MELVRNRGSGTLGSSHSFGGAADGIDHELRREGVRGGQGVCVV